MHSDFVKSKIDAGHFTDDTIAREHLLKLEDGNKLIINESGTWSALKERSRERTNWEDRLGPPTEPTGRGNGEMLWKKSPVLGELKHRCAG